eukprot:TRINITY_DN3562_c0_g2_i1.p1 TRINITY_DN3562_c0_g2~~TRINITY_DN3562_c0_g2_i1.p1  ORF type:complete len:180 (+),score=33.36 TRINITY_DN3562_c0_g2_i1:204-743(+)
MTLDAKRRENNRLDVCCWVIREKNDIEIQARPKGMSHSSSTASDVAPQSVVSKWDFPHQEVDEFGNPLPQTPFAKWLQGTYVPVLLKWWVKAIVIAFFVCLLAFNIWSALQLEQNFRVKDLAQDGSYLIEYEDETNWMWGELPTQVNIYTRRAVDFTQDLTIERLKEMRTRASDSTKNQ